jgi:hypothetical protein
MESEDVDEEEEDSEAADSVAMQPRPLAVDAMVAARRRHLNASTLIAVPLSVDHTCGNPTEAEDVRARSNDVFPLRPNTGTGAVRKAAAARKRSVALLQAAVSGPAAAASSSSSSGASAYPAAPSVAPEDASNLRVGGSLVVTRAFGDMYLKTERHSYDSYREGCPYITGEPEVTWHAVQPGDRFLIVACDGIWDVLTNAQAVEVVAQAVCDEVALPVLRSLQECTSGGNGGGGAGGGAAAPEPLAAAASALRSQDAVEGIGSRVPVRLGLGPTPTGFSNNVSSHPGVRPFVAASSSAPSRVPLATVASSASVPPARVDALPIAGIVDAYLGDPAQRLVGAALVQQAKKQTEARLGRARALGRDESTVHTAAVSLSDFLRLQCKSPAHTQAQVSSTRRGFHDDMTAIVVLIPQFMVEETARGSAGAAAASSTAAAAAAVTAAAAVAAGPSPALSTDGIDELHLPAPQERFSRNACDRQLDWRARLRAERSLRADAEWPLHGPNAGGGGGGGGGGSGKGGAGGVPVVGLGRSWSDGPARHVVDSFAVSGYGVGAGTTGATTSHLALRRSLSDPGGGAVNVLQPPLPQPPPLRIGMPLVRPHGLSASASSSPTAAPAQAADGSAAAVGKAAGGGSLMAWLRTASAGGTQAAAAAAPAGPASGGAGAGGGGGARGGTWGV